MVSECEVNRMNEGLTKYGHQIRLGRDAAGARRQVAAVGPDFQRIATTGARVEFRPFRRRRRASRAFLVRTALDRVDDRLPLIVHVQELLHVVAGVQTGGEREKIHRDEVLS